MLSLFSGSGRQGNGHIQNGGCHRPDRRACTSSKDQSQITADQTVCQKTKPPEKETACQDQTEKDHDPDHPEVIRSILNQSIPPVRKFQTAKPGKPLSDDIQKNLKILYHTITCCSWPSVENSAITVPLFRSFPSVSRIRLAAKISPGYSLS